MGLFRRKKREEVAARLQPEPRTTATAPPEIPITPPEVPTTPPEVPTAQPDVVTAQPDAAAAPPDVATAQPDVATAPPDAGTPDVETGPEVPVDPAAATTAQGAARRDVTTEARPDPNLPGWGRSIGQAISKGRDDRPS